LRLAFYGLAVGLALVHVFITFRGLNSATGMEQAQLARELARGHGYETKMLRPYAWAMLERAGKEASPLAMPEITQPPLQPLILAPLFKMLEDRHPFAPGKEGGIYLLDRVVAGVGAAGFLLMVLWTHGTARRLFDEAVAGVTAVALVLCEPLWQVAVSGSPVALLLPLFALAVRLLVALVEAEAEDEPLTMRMIALGGACAAMVLTHWMAVWLVLGVVLAVGIALPRRRTAAAVVAAVPLLALAAMALWMTQRSGDPMGGAKTLFQAHLLAGDMQSLQRQFGVATPGVAVDALVRKLGVNLQDQLGDLPAHLAWLLPALFFLPALLHRFRRDETQLVKLGLGAALACVFAGLSLTGLPEGAKDDAALYAALAPAMTAFGVAMMALLWARLHPMSATFWATRGYAVIAIAISALPMLANLPPHLKMGLTMGSKFFPHWPPYLPAQVTVLPKILEPNEVVFSDAPWFVAWYADVPAVWLPNKRSEFALLKARIEAKQARVAGVVMTPISARVNYLSDALTGPYKEWPDLIFRGPMMAFDREFPAREDFPYNVPLPLLAVPVGDKESLSVLMTFYSDKLRTPRG
jgi:hypothetical protein